MNETVFPQAGVAARRWRRFELDLRCWLETPEGRFAAYLAERERTWPAARLAVGASDVLESRDLAPRA